MTNSFEDFYANSSDGAASEGNNSFEALFAEDESTTESKPSDVRPAAPLLSEVTFPTYEQVAKETPTSKAAKARAAAARKAQLLLTVGVPQAISSGVGGAVLAKDVVKGAALDVVEAVDTRDYGNLGNKAVAGLAAVDTAIGKFGSWLFGTGIKSTADALLATGGAAGTTLAEKLQGKQSDYVENWKKEYQTQQSQPNLLTAGISMVFDEVAKSSQNAFDKAAGSIKGGSNVTKQLTGDTTADKAAKSFADYFAATAEENTQEYIADKVARGEEPNLDLVDQIVVAVPNLAAFIVGGGAVRKGLSKVVSTQRSAQLASATNVLWESGMEADQTFQELRKSGLSDDQAAYGAMANFGQNLSLIHLTNRIDGFFDENTYRGLQRIISYGFKAGGEGIQEGLQQVSQNANTGKPLTEGLTESMLVGGIMGLGGTVIFDVIAYGKNKDMSPEEIDAIVDADSKIPADKKEVVKKIAKGEATEEEKEQVFLNELKDEGKNAASLAGAAEDLTGQTTAALLEDIKTAINKGFDASDVAQALQIKYKLPEEEAQTKVALALKELSTPKEETKPAKTKKTKTKVVEAEADFTDPAATYSSAKEADAARDKFEEYMAGIDLETSFAEKDQNLTARMVAQLYKANAIASGEKATVEDLEAFLSDFHIGSMAGLAFTIDDVKEAFNDPSSDIPTFSLAKDPKKGDNKKYAKATGKSGGNKRGGISETDGNSSGEEDGAGSAADGNGEAAISDRKSDGDTATNNGDVSGNGDVKTDDGRVVTEKTIKVGDRFTVDKKKFVVTGINKGGKEYKFVTIDQDRNTVTVNFGYLETGYLARMAGITSQQLLDRQNAALKAAKKTTQKDKVKEAVKNGAKSIKEVADETGILEPNVRRILGVGAKEGVFERVAEGVYTLKKDNGEEVAWVIPEDAIKTLPKLAKEGFKADMVFLDIPYDTPAVKGGNRGRAYNLISVDDFDKVLAAASDILRDESSPVIYMYSQAKSGLAKMQQYTDLFTKYGFQAIGKGEYQKTFKDGSPVTNVRGEVAKPEGIIVFNKNGEGGEEMQLNFKLVRPKGYDTEKPAEMLAAMIEMTTEEGDVILDPFAGSGVTGAEAVKQNRKVVLIEKDPDVAENITKPRVEKAIPKTEAKDLRSREALLEEAKNYQNSNDFINGVGTLISHITNVEFDDFDPAAGYNKSRGEYDYGTWFSIGESEPTPNFPILKERILLKGTNLLPEEESSDMLDEDHGDMKYYEYFMSKGYDGVDYGNGAIILFEPEKTALHEATLQDIWAEAHGKKRKTTPTAKAVTNEDIEEAVREITQVDAKTQEITLFQASDEKIARVQELAANFKSGGVTKKGRGILDEYYTDKELVGAVFSMLDIAPNSTVLEPSIGIGNFVPPTATNVDGYEINPVTAMLAKVLNPKATIFNKSFETNFIDDRGNAKSYEQKYDLVIGNPPYGEHRGLYKGLGEEESIAKYEDYFTKRGLDVTKQGGYVVFVLPSSFLMRESNKAKQAILASNGVLVDAFRLPNGVFQGTDIGTDIVILKKGTEAEAKANFKHLIENNFFITNPQKILGKATFKKNRFGEVDDYIEGTLEEALSKLNALNIQRIAIGVAEKAGIETTPENIDNITTVIDDSSTGDVQAIVTEEQNKEKEEEKKRADAEKAKAKKIIDKIKQTAARPLKANQKNLMDTQGKSFTEEELSHWANRKLDGSMKEGFAYNDDLVSYHKGKMYLNFTYLQGDIYQKLEDLEADKSSMSLARYQRQKKALEAIKPQNVKIMELKLNANSSFLNDYEIKGLNAEENTEKRSVANDFLRYLRQVPNEALGNLLRDDIEGYVRGTSVRGGSKDDNERVRRLRPIIANELLGRYLRDLKETNPEQFTDIENAYNRQFNSVHIPDYSEVPIDLTVNDKLNGKDYEVTDVQRQAIARLIEKGVGILAHDVGFGKTLTSILAVYKNMQYGFTKKPLFVVPNATYKQWVATISEIVPDVKVNSLYNLGADYAGNLSDLKINDGEFNVVSEEGFKMLSFKEETYNHYAATYKYITDDLNDSKTEREKEKDRITTDEDRGKMKKGTRADLFFEDLGFDTLVIDEVHDANNIITRINMPKEKATEYRAIGKPTKPSQYGMKAWLASQYIQDSHEGKNVYLLSATPFTNSPLQYFSVLSLVANKALARMGVDNVNDFLNQFVEVETRVEYKPNGSFKEKQLVRNFKNFRLLRRLLEDHVDFKSGEDNPQLIRPVKRQEVNMFPKSDDYNFNERDLQEKFKNPKDAMQLIGQLRALSISSALLKGSAPSVADAKKIVENSPKLYTIARNIINNQNLNKKAGRVATEIVYTPIGVEILPVLKKYLVTEGKMKPEEIEIITGETSRSRRAQIQNDFNGVDEDGKPKETKLRILMGTDTIGTGLNLQKRTTDIHFLGLPWNFTDLIQVEGRAWRQGNIWANVRMNHYLMENSYDAVHFQILSSKQRRYELAIKNNEDDVDVGDVNVEASLSSLITDPVLIAQLRILNETRALQEESRTKNAELAFAVKKVSRLADAEGEVSQIERNIVTYKREIADDKTSDYMRNYYQREVERMEGSLTTKKERVQEVLNYYREQGVDVDTLVATIEPLKAAIKVIDEKMNALKESGVLMKYMEEAKASLPEVKTFAETDVKALTDRYTKMSKDFYVLETRKSETPEKKKAAENEVTIAETVESKPAKTKKARKEGEKKAPVKTKTTVKKLKITPELAVINDKSLSTKEKVEKLLDQKQENKEHKDAGQRVAGSKKERAAIRTIYEHGDSSLLNELIDQVGWEVVFETLSKEELLADTGVETFIHRDFENEVAAGVVKAKIALIDKIRRVPKLAGYKKGKYSWRNHVKVAGTTLSDDGTPKSFHSPEGIEILSIAKLYPKMIRQVVSAALDYNGTSEQNLAATSIRKLWFDGDGMLVDATEETKNKSYWSVVGVKYVIEPEAFFTDKNTVNDLINAGAQYDWKTEKYIEPEFKVEEYESIFKPVKKTVEKSDDRHGNFEAIDKYDVGDKEIPKEKVTSENLMKEYGFASVQLGNYMDDASSYEHIQQTMGAVENMSRSLNVDIKALIQDKKLNIAFGARGGGRFLAHYEPKNNIINMTKKRGDGSFAHEFGHFIDFAVGSYRGGLISNTYHPKRRYYTEDIQARTLMRALERGEYSVPKTFTPNDDAIEKFLPSEYWSKKLEVPRFVEAIMKAYEEYGDKVIGKSLYVTSKGEPSWSQYESINYPYSNTYSDIPAQLIANLTGKTIEATEKVPYSKFFENAKKIGGSGNTYWSSKVELFARAFEAYVFDKMQGSGNVNKYAVRDNVAQTEESFVALAYPQGAERAAFNKLFDALFAKMRTKYPLYTEQERTTLAELNSKIEELNNQRSVKKAEANALPRSDTTGERERLLEEENKLFIEQYTLEKQAEKIRNDKAQYKYKVGKTISVPTATGAFLEEAQRRLGIAFDVQFFDRILGQSGEAYGVSTRSSIGLAADAPYYTEHHELLHLTLNNIESIGALKHLKRADILKEKATELGIPEQYDTEYVEEALAADFEQYVIEKYAPKGKIAQVFSFLRDQLRKFMAAIGKRPTLVQEYFDLLLHGHSVEAAFVDLSNRREFAKYIDGQTLKAYEMTEDADYKMKDIVSGYNDLVEQIRANQKIMAIVAKYAEKSSLDAVVQQAHDQVQQFVKLTTELDNIREDINFLALVRKVAKTREAQQAIEAKLLTTEIKIKNAKKRKIGTTKTVVADAVAKTAAAHEGNENEGAPAPKPTGEELLDEMLVTSKPEVPAGKGISAFQHRVVDQLAMQNRDDVFYDKVSKINEVAKAEKYYKLDKKRAIAVASGLEAPPTDVTQNTMSLVVIAKAQEEKNNKLVAKVVRSLSLRATRQGQEIAMLANAFGEHDPESYMQKLIAERKLLARKRYKPAFSTTTSADTVETIVKRKAADARKKTNGVSLKTQLETKAKEIDDFLSSIMC